MCILKGFLENLFINENICAFFCNVIFPWYDQFFKYSTLRRDMLKNSPFYHFMSSKVNVLWYSDIKRWVIAELFDENSLYGISTILFRTGTFARVKFDYLFEHQNIIHAKMNFFMLYIWIFYNLFLFLQNLTIALWFFNMFRNLFYEKKKNKLYRIFEIVWTCVTKMKNMILLILLK